MKNILITPPEIIKEVPQVEPIKDVHTTDELSGLYMESKFRIFDVETNQTLAEGRA